MNKLLLLSAAIFASINMYGQGTVNFGNNAGSAVTNKVTGAKIINGNTFTAQLWYAADTGAVPTADQMIPIAGTTGISPIPGLITGGTKVVPNTPVGTAAYFQIRIWETAYGTTWAEASTKTLNGRGAIAGQSDILKVTTGNPDAVPPGLPGSLTAAGLKAFTVDIVPEPSIIGLGLLGAGSFLFLRRRK
jgi:hypothetical protein